MGNLSGVASETLRELANRLRLCELSLGLEVDHEEKNSDLFTTFKDGPNDQSQCAQDDYYCCPIKPRRKRRAAVLVCLFEGHGGELRVILTKRSMKLPSYPGIYELSASCRLFIIICFCINTTLSHNGYPLNLM